jgi:putative ABC transport system substrate-binding protein
MRLQRVGRRRLLTLLCGAVAWPLGARAQPAMPVIGILHSQTPDSEATRLRAIELGLAEAGFAADRNLRIEQRFAEGRNERLPMLAAELVRLPVGAIVANTTPPALAAKAATATIPIVFVTGVDPVELGLVASFNRPGGNVTGVTFLSNKIVAKRLELMCNMVPGTTPIGMLVARNNPNTEADVRDTLAAANALGRVLHVERVGSEADIEAAVGGLLQRGIGMLFVAPQADFRLWSQQLVALATRHALPTSFASSDHVSRGGLMSYGPDQLESYRAAGLYAGRVLLGEKPADLPVMVATKFEFVINLTTAKTLGLAVPPTLLVLATGLIE